MKIHIDSSSKTYYVKVGKPDIIIATQMLLQCKTLSKFAAAVNRTTKIQRHPWKLRSVGLTADWVHEYIVHRIPFLAHHIHESRTIETLTETIVYSGDNMEAFTSICSLVHEYLLQPNLSHRSTQLLFQNTSCCGAILPKSNPIALALVNTHHTWQHVSWNSVLDALSL